MVINIRYAVYNLITNRECKSTYGHQGDAESWKYYKAKNETDRLVDPNVRGAYSNLRIHRNCVLFST